jgi:hypothetical protein
MVTAHSNLRGLGQVAAVLVVLTTAALTCRPRMLPSPSGRRF